MAPFKQKGNVGHSERIVTPDGLANSRALSFQGARSLKIYKLFYAVIPKNWVTKLLVSALSVFDFLQIHHF
jgi:hypothetical protein